MTLHSATSSAEATPAISRIGRFYITRELGRGSVGCVYLGHDPVIGRDVAIKTLPPRVGATEKSRGEQQFLNEARAVGRLTHPNIVTIYDASTEGGTPYIAMEYLQGLELSKMLDAGHRFKPDEVASIVWKIADALDHAHTNEVIHRDIKPANIFMGRDNQPKLVDFGIARAPNRLVNPSSDPDQPYTLFRHNILGTPNYMSPEQAAGKPVDARTDIYSLGAVMYEMLVGRKPFRCDDTEKLLEQIAYKAPQAPYEIDPRIPLILSQIVMKAMSKRPEKRYADAGKMALDLKRYLVQERRERRRMRIPVQALDPSSGNAPARTVEPRTIIWVVGAAIAVSAAISLFILLH